MLYTIHTFDENSQIELTPKGSADIEQFNGPTIIDMINGEAPLESGTFGVMFLSNNSAIVYATDGTVRTPALCFMQEGMAKVLEDMKSEKKPEPEHYDDISRRSEHRGWH